MKSNPSRVVVETGVFVGASKEFSDGRDNKFTDTFGGICYIGIDVDGKTEYHWGHALSISNFAAPKDTLLVTLK